MNKKDAKRQKKAIKEYKFVSIRIAPQVKTWLKNKGFSATAIFMSSIKDLGYKDNDK